MYRLLNLLLYILIKHISPERGQHVQVRSRGVEVVLLSRDTLSFADTLCSLFKVSEMFKVDSQQSEVKELTSVGC